MAFLAAHGRDVAAKRIAWTKINRLGALELCDHLNRRLVAAGCNILLVLSAELRVGELLALRLQSMKISDECLVVGIAQVLEDLRWHGPHGLALRVGAMAHDAVEL